MRTTHVLSWILAGATLSGGGRLGAQAVERTDLPAAGVLRVTVDPRIMTWNDEFTDHGRMRLGDPLSGDTIGARTIPVIARLQQNVRFVSGVGAFVANLGAGLLSAYQERRTYPVKAEYGLTQRLSVSLMVPLVRVATRTALQLTRRGQNLSLNPRLKTGVDAAYVAFFTQFDSSLARLDRNISAGQYGCMGASSCAARDSSSYWHAVRKALYEMAFGVGQQGAPFLPIDSTTAGQGIDSTVARIERDLAAAPFGVTGFSGPFPLPTDSVTGDLVAAAILDSARGFGYANLPFRDGSRYGFGDLELAAKYRFSAGAHYRAALQALVRLPTSAPDSDADLLRQRTGEHRFDLEGQLTQELLAGPAWVNVAIRAGRALPGTRVRRVAPRDAFLVPFAATATLRWEPGDYVGVDVAPLIQLAPEFAAGFTASYWTQARDHYAFQSAADSVALGLRLGGAIAAGVLDQGTSERRVRLGFAATYHGPTVEGGFSVEQTVSGADRVPGATLYRLVLRLARRLF